MLTSIKNICNLPYNQCIKQRELIHNYNHTLNIENQTKLIIQKYQNNQSQKYIKNNSRKRYLSLISQSKRPNKSKITKRPAKKNNSVILGGEKKYSLKSSFFTQTTNENPQNQQLHKSCVCKLHQNTKMIQQIPLISNMNNQIKSIILQKSVIQGNDNHAINIPNNHVQYFSKNCQNSNNINKNLIQNINKIVQHKLKFSNGPIYVRPAPITSKIIQEKTLFKNSQSQTFKIQKRRLSSGSIYSTSKNSNAENENFKQTDFYKTVPSGPYKQNIWTPRFDKEQHQYEAKSQKKSRRNVGFIYSTSQLKQKRNQSEKKMTNLNYNNYNSTDPFLKSKSIQNKNYQSMTTLTNQVQIQTCMNKMSIIRQQIDNLQNFLKDKIQNAEYKRSKSMCGSVCIENKKCNQTFNKDFGYLTADKMKINCQIQQFNVKNENNNNEQSFFSAKLTPFQHQNRQSHPIQSQPAVEKPLKQYNLFDSKISAIDSLYSSQKSLPIKQSLLIVQPNSKSFYNNSSFKKNFIQDLCKIKFQDSQPIHPQRLSLILKKSQKSSTNLIQKIKQNQQNLINQFDQNVFSKKLSCLNSISSYNSIMNEDIKKKDENINMSKQNYNNIFRNMNNKDEKLLKNNNNYNDICKPIKREFGNQVNRVI